MVWERGYPTAAVLTLLQVSCLFPGSHKFLGSSSVCATLLCGSSSALANGSPRSALCRWACYFTLTCQPVGPNLGPSSLRLPHHSGSTLVQSSLCLLHRLSSLQLSHPSTTLAPSGFAFPPALPLSLIPPASPQFSSTLTPPRPPLPWPHLGLQEVWCCPVSVSSLLCLGLQISWLQVWWLHPSSAWAFVLLML